MKEFQLCGLGNAIVDIFLEVTEAEFAALGFERGGMRLVDLSEHGLRVPQQHASGIGQDHAVVPAIEQPCADAFFEPRQLL